ncbi:hypothetical protein MKW98_004813 [Papaver atlanticum]|uniref:Uncharacterized protein n=1 Tax=Papaver atlanticum TaxID=357466 RepID=A0AAD4SJB0_9MAGN|nr:hypothetical protein MKW98_004813 [Papaver atlanticum]
MAGSDDRLSRRQAETGHMRRRATNHQVSAGKEKEAVYNMLSYLQPGYVADLSEMQYAVFSKGPHMPYLTGRFPIGAKKLSCYLKLEKKISTARVQATVQLIKLLPDDIISSCPASSAFQLKQRTVCLYLILITSLHFGFQVFYELVKLLIVGSPVNKDVASTCNWQIGSGHELGLIT